MERKLSVVICGTGGYGAKYLEAVLADRTLRLAGVVQRHPEKHPELLMAMQTADTPVFDSLDAFYAAHRADVAIIATPIHLHESQCALALRSGSHVLCEKPLASDFAGAMALERLAADEGVMLQLGVGYQRSSCPAMLALKKDVLAGRYGKPLRASALGLMPRREAYFSRSDWAGRTLAQDGRPVLDSVLHNAGSHQLHALLYLLGPDVDASAQVLSLWAECARANDIDSFDTCALSLKTRPCDVFFAATHACHGVNVQRIRIEWEQGVLDFDYASELPVTVQTSAGDVVYGQVDNSVACKLQGFVDCFRRNAPLPCSAAAAKEEVAAAVGTYLSAEVVQAGYESRNGVDGIYRVIPGIEDKLARAFEKGKLPADLGEPIGQPGRSVTRAEIIRAFF